MKESEYLLEVEIYGKLRMRDEFMFFNERKKIKEKREKSEPPLY